MTKKNNIVGHAPIVFAFLFLFNPNITIIDILPDFVGYILLCIALYRVADVHERVGEAYQGFKRMIFIDAAKWLAVFWIFGMTVPSERNTSILLWTFVFSVLEMIFLLPTYVKLFDGMTQIGYLYPCRSIFGRNEKKSKTDRVRNLTVAFIVTKAVLTFLPELADLTSSSYDESLSGFVDLYRYIGLMRGMAFIPVLFFGVIWVIFVISYFRRIVNDSELMNALALKYDADVRPKKGLFVRRNFATFTLIVAIALLLTVDIRIDDNNILPDFIAAVFFAIAFGFIGKYNGFKANKWIFSSGALFCFSILSAILEYMFFKRYYYGAIIKSDEARNMYMIVVALNIVKGLCQMGVFFDLYRSLWKTVSIHTGFVVGRERSIEDEKRSMLEVHKELKRSLVIALIFGMIYVVSDICFDILAPSVDFMGLINVIFAVACVGTFLRAFSEIQHAIDTKYMLE